MYRVRGCFWGKHSNRFISSLALTNLKLIGSSCRKKPLDNKGITFGSIFFERAKIWSGKTTSSELFENANIPETLTAGHQHGTSSTNFDPEIPWTTISPQNCKISTSTDTSMRNKLETSVNVKSKTSLNKKSKQGLSMDNTQSLVPTFFNPTADLDINMVVEWNIKSSLVNCLRCCWTLKWKLSHVTKRKGFHAV